MNMQKLFGPLLLLAMALGACENEQLLVGDREHDNQHLERLWREIDSLSGLYPCEEASEWRFTAIGAKACGGPTGYVAYAVHLDEEDFLEKVERYTRLQDAYNRKWNVISDCMFLTPPDRVVCEDGKPKLLWDNRVVLD